MHESFVEYKSLYTEDAFRATTPNADQLARRMDEGPVWVATTQKEIVGTVSAVERGDDLYIRGMAVLPRARGYGIGELLLIQIEDFGRSRSCNRLVLSTTPFLDRAIKLYERYGFQPAGEGPHDLFGTPLFTMVKLSNHASTSRS
ncbi:MAG TPA: GNAT family N-acetyltransferase [Pyrinomonadaceae bacterium]|nr:GNAT family N-acetyltransferase [Pyrinomonadaceae bacterium]